MIKNVGSTDKVLRIVVGIVLVALAFLKLGGISSAGGIVAVVAGAVLILTAVVNFCPIYRIFGLRTFKLTE